MIGNALAILLCVTIHAATPAQPTQTTRLLTDEEVFHFIASHEDLGDAEVPDRSVVFKLASESCVDYLRSRPDDWYLIIRADYLHKNHISAIRGAQGNGPFYVFREAGGTFTFLGVMLGNAYTQTSGEKHIGFNVSAHAGGGKTSTAHYEVIGDALVQR